MCQPCFFASSRPVICCICSADLYLGEDGYAPAAGHGDSRSICLGVLISRYTHRQRTTGPIDAS